MNNVINKYLIFNFLKIILNVILVFVCLGVILNLFEEIEFFKNLNTGIGLPLLLTIMFIPNLIIKLLPFIIFIASMWFLIFIKSNRDLLSLKIFGFSNLKLITILSLTSFVFGIIVLFAINPLTSSMVKYYEITKAKYSIDIDHLVAINKNGVWIKEKNKDSSRITTAKKLSGQKLINVTIYNLNNKNNILERVESEKVDISSNLWVIYEPTTYNIDGEKVKTNKGNYQIKSDYNFKTLNLLLKNLDTISFVDLITEYDSLLELGYTKEKLDEKLNSLYSMPIFLILMVILASIFTLGSISSSQNIYYIFISIITCVLIYYFKDLSIALGQTNRISLTLAVWMPLIAVSLFCSIGVIQINEK
tara:strand:- start:492 stop:1577 length:1086 start_codon:yes stop_codon:yes gene_type:complete